MNDNLENNGMVDDNAAQMAASKSNTTTDTLDAVAMAGAVQDVEYGDRI
jgi:hypothetical protein